MTPLSLHSGLVISSRAYRLRASRRAYYFGPKAAKLAVNIAITANVKINILYCSLIDYLHYYIR